MLSFILIPFFVIGIYSYKKFFQTKINLEYDETIQDELHLFADSSLKINKLIEDINLDIYDNQIMEDLVKKQIWVKIMDVDEDTKRFILSELHNKNYILVSAINEKKHI